MKEAAAVTALTSPSRIRCAHRIEGSGREEYRKCGESVEYIVASHAIRRGQATTVRHYVCHYHAVRWAAAQHVQMPHRVQVA